MTLSVLIKEIPLIADSAEVQSSPNLIFTSLSLSLYLLDSSLS